MTSVSLRLPSDVAARLQKLADLTGRSKTYYMLEAIQEHLDDLEDIYMAEAVLERVRRGDEPVYSLDELEKRRALAD